jgi:integrase
VDLESATAHVVRALVSVDHVVMASGPKTKRGRRSVALDGPTVAALRRQRVLQAERRLAWASDWTETDLVFDRGNGEAMHPEQVSKSFRRLVKAAGVQMIRLHDLRHTRASLLLAAGANPKVVSEQLGHSTVGFTLDRYSHLLPGVAEDAAAKAAALLYGSG